MNAYFYSSGAKRFNSTKHIVGGSSVDVKIKMPCSIEQPVLLVSSDYLNTNYFKMQWGTKWYYYFVSDISIVSNDVIEIHGEEDVLATLKTEIGGTTGFCTRSSNENIQDNRVLDNFYPAKAQSVKTMQTIPNVITTDRFFTGTTGNTSGGLYCVGISCRPSNSLNPTFQRGSVSYYFMTTVQMATLMSNLMANHDNMNWLSVIVSAVWLPISFVASEWHAQTGSLNILNQTIAIDCMRNDGINADGLYTVKTGQMNIPVPTVDAYRHYMQYSPYCKHTLYAGCFGSIPIDATLFPTGMMMYTISIDLATGQGNFIMKDTSSRIAYNLTGQMGMPIQLTQATNFTSAQIAGTVANAVNVGASAVSGNAFGVVMGLASTVNSLISASMPTVTTTGSNGSMTELKTVTYQLVCTSYEFPDDANTLVGRPVYKSIAISLSENSNDYYKFSVFPTNFPCSQFEQDKIQNFACNTGFYYE